MAGTTHPQASTAARAAARWVTRLVLLALALLVAAALAILVVIPRATHGTAMTVLTGSMTPTSRSGRSCVSGQSTQARSASETSPLTRRPQERLTSSPTAWSRSTTPPHPRCSPSRAMPTEAPTSTRCRPGRSAAKYGSTCRTRRDPRRAAWQGRHQPLRDARRSGGTPSPSFRVPGATVAPGPAEQHVERPMILAELSTSDAAQRHGLTPWRPRASGAPSCSIKTQRLCDYSLCRLPTDW